jgi:hypothetical protein
MGRFTRVGIALLAVGVIAANSTAPAAAQSDTMDSVSYDEDAYADDRPLAPPPWDKAVGAVLSFSSMMFNVVVFPVKLLIGVAGAEVGGLAGALNGGDNEAAAGVWNVTTDGSYFVTPQILDGRDRFYYAGESQ